MLQQKLRVLRFLEHFNRCYKYTQNHQLKKYVQDISEILLVKLNVGRGALLFRAACSEPVCLLLCSCSRFQLLVGDSWGSFPFHSTPDQGKGSRATGKQTLVPSLLALGLSHTPEKFSNSKTQSKSVSKISGHHSLSRALDWNTHWFAHSQIYLIENFLNRKQYFHHFYSCYKKKGLSY